MAFGVWLPLFYLLLERAGTIALEEDSGEWHSWLSEDANNTSSTTAPHEDGQWKHGLSCTLFLKDSDHLNSTITSFVADKSNLLRYNITISGGFGNRMMWRDTSDVIYKPSQWTRIGSASGKVLLALIFNYEAVSLGLLSFGVVDANVTLEERGCRNESEVAEALRRLVYNDFYLYGHDLENNEICHQVIINGPSSYADIAQKCYRLTVLGELEGYIIENRWIDMLHVLLQIVRVFIILFGPLLFQSWLYEGDLQASVPYVVNLRQEDEPEPPDGEGDDDPEEALHLNANLLAPVIDGLWEKVSVCEMDVPSNTKTMHLVVDHTKLMSQSTTPVNVFSFIMDQVIGCGFVKSLWMGTCSAAGCLCGTWLSRRMPGSSPPKQPTWGQVCKCLNVVIVGLFLVPLPFHLRVGVYLYTEAREMTDREAVIAQLGFSRTYYESFWLGICWPIIIYVIYAVYFVTLAMYVLAQGWIYHQFDDIVQDCMFDLKDNSYQSIISMVLYHLVVPFNKFGFLVGLVVAVPYYVVTLPVVLAVAGYYGLPIVYMVGRLFFNLRMNFLNKPIQCCGRRLLPDPVIAESDGNRDSTTLSDIFFLNRISRARRLYRRPPAHRLKKYFRNIFTSREAEVFLSVSISVSMVLLMLSLIIMYAEAIRFLLHMLLLALAGLVLNASHTMDFFILLFWTALYAIRSIQSVHSKYNQMSKNLFGFFKDQLKEEVADATRVPEHLQTFTAFKYFDLQRLAEIEEKMRLYVSNDDDISYSDTKDKLVKNKKYGTVEWDVHALVLFVDRYDLARIPRRLFWRICEQLKAPGCPGPLIRSIGEATKQLLYMILFLFIIYVIIMSFHEVFSPGSSNQLLVTVASGFLPLIIRQLIPRSPSVDLSEYSLKGKIEEILLGYRERWPLEEETIHRNTTGNRKQDALRPDFLKPASIEMTETEKVDVTQTNTDDDDDDVIIVQRFITKEPLLTFGWSLRERMTEVQQSVRCRDKQTKSTPISIVVDSA